MSTCRLGCFFGFMVGVNRHAGNSFLGQIVFLVYGASILGVFWGRERGGVSPPCPPRSLDASCRMAGGVAIRSPPLLHPPGVRVTSRRTRVRTRTPWTRHRLSITRSE